MFRGGSTAEKLLGVNSPARSSLDQSNIENNCRECGVTLERISAMNRLLMIGSMAALLVATTGCLHHNVRGGCSDGSCASGGCSTGSCECGNANCGGSGSCGGACGGNASGIIGHLGSLCGLCGGKGTCQGGCRTGCQAGPIGWQQGGLDYSSHLQPGLLGHKAGAALNSRSGGQYGQGGLPSAQVGYPYYTVRGPRDFLMDNPPTIGR